MSCMSMMDKIHLNLHQISPGTYTIIISLDAFQTLEFGTCSSCKYNIFLTCVMPVCDLVMLTYSLIWCSQMDMVNIIPLHNEAKEIELIHFGFCFRDLSGNQLTGEIPNFGNMELLQTFKVSFIPRDHNRRHCPRPCKSNNSNDLVR
jgi:hypothetical protein